MAVDLAITLATLSNDPTNFGNQTEGAVVDWTPLSSINDGNDATTAAVDFNYGSWRHVVQADLSVACDVSSFEVLYSNGGDDTPNVAEYSDDGSSWTTCPGSWSAIGTPTSGYTTFTITGGPLTHRYWRIGSAGTGTHIPFGLSTWRIIGDPPSLDDVIADFIAEPRSGIAELDVQFTDASVGDPDTWAWDFGDGGTSTSQNPSHTYTDPGSYDVELTATRSADSNSDTETKTEYVVVYEGLAGVLVDWDGDGFDPGTYDEVSGDPQNVLSWTITRGAAAEITGSAAPGSATIVLKNPDDIYNPRNESSPLSGLLRDGTPVWIGVNADGTLAGDNPRGLFGGRITDITLIPSPGTESPATVEIVCEDALGWYRRLAARLDYAEGLSHREFRQAVLGVAGETRYSLAHENQTMPLSHADGTLGPVLDAINSINGTRHLAKPADFYADWYSYTTRNRQWRLDGTSDASLSASSQHVTSTDGWRLSADTVINQQKATVTPVVFTPGNFTVWEAEQLPITVDGDHPYSRFVEFDDVVSYAGVNYASTGDPVTATLSPFGTSAKLELSVDPGDAALVTALTIQGRLARRLPAESYVADDTTSQSAPRGVRAGSEIGNEYLGVIASARGIAQHVTWRYGNPQLRPTLTVENWFPDQFELDLYDVIAFTSTHLGMDAVLFEIVGLTHQANVASPTVQHHVTTYVLQESRVQSDPGWFVLDTSELDSADILAY